MATIKLIKLLIKISMKVIFSINYSGYISILRSVLLLVKANILTLTQLGPYICFVMQADFDVRHGRYRVILRDDKQLADEFGVDPTTIYRYRKAFIKAGLLIEENGLTRVTNYYMFELNKVNKLAKLPIPRLQELFVKPQENFADIEQLIANSQTIQPAIAMQSFSVPSKGESLSSEFTEGDKVWINENVREE